MGEQIENGNIVVVEHLVIRSFVPLLRAESGAISFDLLRRREAMQRSSESIGTIAAALAKAQGELTNPEKSLVATIRPDGPGAAERSFRYAPLSSGLDIVRKTLSQQPNWCGAVALTKIAPRPA
jgi:hypothetical protein